MFRTSLDVELATEIERPAPDVWSFVSDLTRLPDWLEEFKEVVKESDGPAGRGTVFRYTVASGTSTFEIVDWDPGRRLAWDGPPLRWLGGAARPRGYFELAATGADRTRFLACYQPELTGTMALMRPYLARWLRRQRRVDNARLKGILEAAALG